MLKEEDRLRDYIADNVVNGAYLASIDRLITALVRACYEDAAKIYLKQECEEPDPYKIAAAIRSKK